MEARTFEIQLNNLQFRPRPLLVTDVFAGSDSLTGNPMCSVGSYSILNAMQYQSCERTLLPSVFPTLGCILLHVPCTRRVDRLPIKHSQSGFSNRPCHFQRAPALQLCNKTGRRRNTEVTSAIRSGVRGLARGFRRPRRGRAVRSDTWATRVQVNGRFHGVQPADVWKPGHVLPLNQQLGLPLRLGST